MTSAAALTWAGMIQRIGVDDLTLLTKVSESGIIENLIQRYHKDIIYTYIGDVLIAVNPYKRIPMYTNEIIERYNGHYRHEMPPHIFSLAEDTYKSMLQEEENQCIIISGESGAGKTESAKLIMQYIAYVSGSGANKHMEHIKQVILESNPLLEAFGNAKTLRNDNSSRFGKYFEILFDPRGNPEGGFITNYLLEKSRIIHQNVGERNFHIFYQLIAGADDTTRSSLQLHPPDYFQYTRGGQCPILEGVDDAADFQVTKHAMSVIGLNDREQDAVFTLIAGVLHLGNLWFVEKGQSGSTIAEDYRPVLQSSAAFLASSPAELERAVTFRQITTGAGSTSEKYDVPLNSEQACATRDALAKAIYDRLFSWIVSKVNKALKVSDTDEPPLLIGILDIYGFEVFQNNGFEQFCINFVNEKLQQIFIQLTLKAEQEEYVREGIKWEQIDYFNNKVVCDLIEAKNPPGVFCILDDICAQHHAETRDNDSKFLVKLKEAVSSHKHFVSGGKSFTIKHYAGDVEYDVFGFTEKNKDLLYIDLVNFCANSRNPILKLIFGKEKEEMENSRKRPTTAGFKIKSQAESLVTSLMDCSPHYVRCMKPNDQKRPNYFDSPRVTHQVQYLGLLENVRVKRAGFAYRQDYDRFLNRYRLLSSRTFPKEWLGDDKEGVRVLLEDVPNFSKTDYQFGVSRIFIRLPEKLFGLEELLAEEYHKMARKIQRVFRKYNQRKHFVRLRQEMNEKVEGQKQRRKESIFRPWSGDYLVYGEHKPLRAIVEYYCVMDERVIFSDTCAKVHIGPTSHALQPRIFLISTHALYLIEQLQGKDGSKRFELRRRVPFNLINTLSASTLADNLLTFTVSNAQTHNVEWKPDESAPACTMCRNTFTLFFRRHHCRQCGGVFCNDCTPFKALLPDQGFKSAERVCKTCVGKASSEALADFVLECERKTEVMSIVCDRHASLNVRFGDTHAVTARKADGTTSTNQVRFTPGPGDNVTLAVMNGDLTVSVPPGLPQDTIQRLKRAADERSRKTQERWARESDQRKAREAERAVLRERMRQARVDEKKRLKAEAKRQAGPAWGGSRDAQRTQFAPSEEQRASPLRPTGNKQKRRSKYYGAGQAVRRMSKEFVEPPLAAVNMAQMSGTDVSHQPRPGQVSAGPGFSRALPAAPAPAPAMGRGRPLPGGRPLPRPT